MKCFNLSRRRVIIVLIISFLLTLTNVFGYQIEHFSQLSLDALSIGIAVLVFAVNAVLLCGVYSLFDKAATVPDKNKDIKEWKIFIISAGCLLIIYMIQLLAVYPGLFVFDAQWQYCMYVENTISEHQPVFHTVLLGFIVNTIYRMTGAINHGAAAYSVFQIVICVVCIAYFVTFVYKKLKSISGLIMMLVFFGFYPPIVLQVMSATKDTFFFAFFMVLICLTLDLVKNSSEFFKAPMKVTMWILLMALVTVLRNNCIYAIPFFAIAIWCVVKKKKMLIGAMFLGIIALVALYKYFIVAPFVTVAVDGREMYSVPAQQLMRIYNSEEANISEKEREVIDNLFVKDEKENYHPKIADLAKGNLDMVYYEENSSLVNKTYLDLVIKNFKMSVEAFLENTCGFWYPGCELTLYQDGKTGYWVVGCYDPVISNPKIKPLFEFYKLFEDSDFVTKNPITSLFFAPGTFFYIFAIMFAYIIDRKQKEYIPIFVFMLALWLTFLLGPVALVRYIMYFYAIIPLYFVMIYKPEIE